MASNRLPILNTPISDEVLDSLDDITDEPSNIKLQQCNNERLVYVYSKYGLRNFVKCKTNGLYFGKVPRSDELLWYTETDMYNILMTFITLVNPCKFRINYPLWSHFEHWETDEDMTPLDIIYMLDEFFGEGFAKVVSRPLSKVYRDYIQYWRYGQVPNVTINKLHLLQQFATTIIAYRDPMLLFVTNNSLDFKDPLQGKVKVLQ